MKDIQTLENQLTAGQKTLTKLLKERRVLLESFKKADRIKADSDKTFVDIQSKWNDILREIKELDYKLNNAKKSRNDAKVSEIGKSIDKKNEERLDNRVKYEAIKKIQKKNNHARVQARKPLKKNESKILAMENTVKISEARLERHKLNNEKIQIERSTRMIRSAAQKTAMMSPEELLHTNLVKEARAKIDRSVVKNYSNKVIFVTTAVQGAEVDKNFLAAIETFIESRNAELIITTTKAHLKPLRDEEYPLDDIIYEKYQNNVYKQIELNEHLSVVDIDVRPYVSDPLAGLAELGADEGRSYIIAHTQQRMKTYPNGMSKLPRLQQCTGAMTLPLYRNNKAGLMADKRHVIGGIIVEVLTNRFHVRVVQADADGSFVDLGTRYNPNGTVTMERPEALIRGDDHIGFGDIKANIALDDVTAELRPKKIVVHDLFDSASISHHRAHSIKARLEVPEEVKYLDIELKACTKFLQSLNDKKPKDAEILVIAANHNEALHRYLNEGRYVEDIPNYKKAVELAYYYHVLGQDPLVRGVDPGEKLATWVTRTQEAIRVEGIAISNHGDKGPNGSRGSVRGDAVSYGKSSSGHSHSPEIWRGATRVGTTSLLDMDYTAGSPSSWAHCFELIYKGKNGVGLRQLVIAIEGNWRMEEKSVNVPSPVCSKKISSK